MKKLHSIRLSHKKNAEDAVTIEFTDVKQIILPMSQHIGVPCTPVVKPGDYVKVGQLVADTDAFMSSPIYSSVSGEVKEIKKIMTFSGKQTDAVVIESDGKFEMDTSLYAPEITDKKSLVEAIRKSGAVGLGGAAFPTGVKLNYNDEISKVDTLILNGAECEPYICSDDRTMQENSVDIISAVKKLLDILQIPKAVIAIEENKPDAIIKLSEMIKDADSRISIKKLKSSYPQGAEKMMTYSVTGRIVAEGELPLNQGVIVMNVSTAAFLNQYFTSGIPLIKRRVTIDGDCIKKPCNLFVPIGTRICDIYEAQKDNFKSDPKEIILGGIMMGSCAADIKQPVCKANNAVLFFKERKPLQVTSCIHCGSCVKACPMNLMPTELEKAYDTKNYQMLDELKVNLCLNCGSCSYVCPAKRSLAQKNQLAKIMLVNEKKRLSALKK